jgi:predicted nucleic acid-binding protein
VLPYLCQQFSLHQDFQEVYRARYKTSAAFLDEINVQRERDLSDEIYVSALATNELFSAIRDEVRSILFFKKGIPLSRWRDSRNNPEIPEENYEKIYELTLQAFDTLFENHGITITPEVSPWDDANYWSIYSSILFLIKESKTQDATLLTTAILNEADYFVTLDEPLVRSAKKKMAQEYDLHLINPTEGLQLLQKRTAE